MELKYITVEMLKHHMFIDHDLDDELIKMYALAAEHIISNYITESPFISEIDENDVEHISVKQNVVAAIAIYTAILYLNRDEISNKNQTERQLPQSVTSLLATERGIVFS